MKYYVYMYLDLGNIPFYIGKGKKNRYKVQYHLRQSYVNPLLKNKIRKVGVDGVKVKFLHKDLDEKQAFYLENYYIVGIGRRDLGLGPLCNLTDGGEGISGNVRSKELRQHLSKVVKEAWKRKGGHSEEAKRKMIETRTGMKRSEETKKKMSISAIERFRKSGGHSEEAKQKISKKNRGRIPWNRGVLWSEETKQKMRGPRKPYGSKSKEAKQRMEIAQQRRRNKERKLEK